MCFHILVFYLFYFSIATMLLIAMEAIQFLLYLKIIRILVWSRIVLLVEDCGVF